jgi:hypothetical protein
VEHVGVREDDAAAFARGAARVAGGVAVVRDRAVHGEPGVGMSSRRPPPDRGRAPSSGRGRARARRALGQRVEHGQVVTEALSRGGRRRDDEVLGRGLARPPQVRGLEGLGLVRVELGDVAIAQGLGDAGVQALGDGRVAAVAAGHDVLEHHGAVALPLLEHGIEAAHARPRRGWAGERARVVGTSSERVTVRVSRGLVQAVRHALACPRRCRGHASPGLVGGARQRCARVSAGENAGPSRFVQLCRTVPVCAIMQDRPGFSGGGGR